MNSILNNKYLIVLKKIAYYILVLSLSVCTVLSFINWQDGRPEIIQLILNLLYTLRKIISVPVLFVYELLFFINELLSIKQDKNSDKKNFLYSLIFFLFTILIIIFTKQTKLIYFLMMVYFAKDFEYKRILDVHIAGKLFVLLVLIIGNIFGLVFIAEQRGNGFGMVHYNTLAQYLMFLLFALACRYNIDNKRKSLFTILSIVLIVLCYHPIDSRTPILVILIFVLGLWLEQLYKKININLNGLINRIFILSPVMLTVLSAILGLLILYCNFPIDGNLGCRFTDFVNAYNSVGFSLFSRNLTFGDNYSYGMFFFDNHYAKLIFDYGIIFSIIVYFGFVISNIRITKANIYALMISTLCVYIDGVTTGLFDSELIIVLMACAFSKDIFSIACNKNDVN